MWLSSGHRKSKRASSAIRQSIMEALEQRQMLSASIPGYTPAQIRTAYGFNSISFSSGATANGAGQTIAIIDAYNDPKINSDLNVFDSQFGLASASLTVVNENGGSVLPSTDAGWAGEISLDVEWAHATAPGAKILLVEANSDSISDLMDAVNYARNAAGVSVVSMSWGGSEFFSWDGGEDASETDYDSYFTTPAGHQGVTFVAAAGDSGTSEGVDYPAASPNVISVGGTTLNLADSSGTYGSESSWSGTSGGYSQVESEPTYQDGVQSTGFRSVPDVAYDADPNTGFAVYDSVAYEGYVGWQEVGGTSAGSPQWAAIIAIADQGRVLAGDGTLDGASQTLPLLYSLYSGPDTTGYSTYTSFFNDVVDNPSTGHNPYHWRFGGYGSSGTSAIAGYDAITGLGTPKVAAIVNALTGVSTGPVNTGGSGSSGGSSSGSSGGSSTASNLPASPLDGVFASTLAASAVSGSQEKMTLDLTNVSTSSFSGPVTIDVYMSPDTTLSSSDTFVASVSISKLNLQFDASKVEHVRFDIPDSLSAGSYYLIASISAVDTDTAAAVTATPTTVAVSPATVDIAAAFAASQPIAVTPGKRTGVAITLTNNGNVTASGKVAINLYASTSQTLDASIDALLAALTNRTIHLRAGHSITLHLHFQAPADLTPGSYYLIASSSSTTSPADTNTANNVAVIDTQSA